MPTDTVFLTIHGTTIYLMYIRLIFFVRVYRADYFTELLQRGVGVNISSSLRTAITQNHINAPLFI